MMINLQNYEAYFIRYIDQDLSKTEMEAVHQFLHAHPDLQSDFDAFRSTILRPETMPAFPAKHLLKRAVHEDNFETYFVRYVEEDLSSEEREGVNEFVAANPQYKKQLDAYGAAKLMADTSIVFPNKDALKKKGAGRVVTMNLRYLLSAAVAATLLMVFLLKGLQWLPGTENISTPEVAAIQPEANQTSPARTVTEPSINSTLTGVSSATESQTTATSHGRKSFFAKKDHTPTGTESTDTQVLFAEAMQPLSNAPAEAIPHRQIFKKAPYLVPVYDETKPEEQPHRNLIANNSSLGGWLSIASVIGTEVIKLSGRGELLKSNADDEQPKKKEPVTLSIQTKKFAFYHKFLKRNKGTDKN